MAVLLVFALLAAISGVHEVSLGADQGEATSPKHRRKMGGARGEDPAQLRSRD
jgi:hypothetical protein